MTTHRYSVHPGIRRMGGTPAEAAAYLREAPGMVEAMYQGKRTALRSLHDLLEDLALSLGADITLCPGKTIVPIYRRHVIAQIKPATNTRIDFGLALGSRKGAGRLIETGGFARKDRITHRMAVTGRGDVDEELRRWLREAYRLDGSTDR